MISVSALQQSELWMVCPAAWARWVTKVTAQSPRDFNMIMKTPTYRASSGKLAEYFLKEMSFNEPNDS